MRQGDKPLTNDDAVVRVDHPELARGMFGRLYDVMRIDVEPGADGNFAWEWNVASRGGATMIQGHARSGAATMCGAPPVYCLTLVQEGGITISAGSQAAQVTANRTGAIINANVDVATFTHPGTRTNIVRIDPAALSSHLSALVGMPVSGPVVFDVSLDLQTACGADVLRLAQVLLDAAARPDTPLGSPHVIAHLREAMFSALLTGHNSTVSHYFRKPAVVANARAVKIAEEILEARAADPISIAEVADLVGISLRSLERSYKEVRGQTLRDFLKMRRLELAHRRLATAAPGTTVTQVLYASGFSHPGEFSRAYRERFGASPSDTLRRALHSDTVVAKSR